jgi:hypothetical protein
VRLIVFLCVAAAYAQAPSSKPPAGLEPAWDIAVVLQEIGAHAGRLLPVLDQLDVPAWVAKGASDTYAAQLESSRQQTHALADEAAALARNPEKLCSSVWKPWKTCSTRSRKAPVSTRDRR